jgi:hypothetical protein
MSGIFHYLYFNVDFIFSMIGKITRNGKREVCPAHLFVKFERMDKHGRRGSATLKRVDVC